MRTRWRTSTKRWLASGSCRSDGPLQWCDEGILVGASCPTRVGASSLTNDSATTEIVRPISAVKILENGHSHRPGQNGSHIGVKEDGCCDLAAFAHRPERHRTGAEADHDKTMSLISVILKPVLADSAS